MPVDGRTRHIARLTFRGVAMKHRAWLAIPFALALAGTVQAQSPNACTGEGATADPGVPCIGAQVDPGLLRLPDYADPAQRDGASAPSMLNAPAQTEPTDAPPFTGEPSAPDAPQGFPFVGA
jgi:hypothetical protein